MIHRLSFIFAFLVLVSSVHARDERSVKDLSKALAALAPDVDPAEAELLSETAHMKARSLAKEYRVVLNPEFTVFLVNIGKRKRGWCGHWAQDLGARLKEPLRGWNPFRRLAQGGTIVLVPGEKRRRIRSRTTLRPFRNHDVEREHEVERMAAGVPNSPTNAANSQRARAALISTHFLPTHGAAAERLVFRGDAMHIVKCRT